MGGGAIICWLVFTVKTQFSLQMLTHKQLHDTMRLFPAFVVTFTPTTPTEFVSTDFKLDINTNNRIDILHVYYQLLL